MARELPWQRIILRMAPRGGGFLNSHKLMTNSKRQCRHPNCSVREKTGLPHIAPSTTIFRHLLHLCEAVTGKSAWQALAQEDKEKLKRRWEEKGHLLIKSAEVIQSTSPLNSFEISPESPSTALEYIQETFGGDTPEDYRSYIDSQFQNLVRLMGDLGTKRH
ncbi:hypothetical protein PROFUN_12580 [Planoprotostelium fungivorum]|uniref:Uncharacterized protein n=1 Tax=Planoprotostelium fungivorum TaxID=1890364 RepID=A0A2P6N6V1_9EUKA|nr:hypothetical protein PROFUN_12580 [Planoprotostelium fungivorum]